MKKRKKVILTLCAFLLIAGVVYAKSIGDIPGTIKTQGIDINIENETSNELLSANKEIKYMPKITNKGTDCYIRYNIKFSDDRLNIDDFKLSDEKNWKMIGDYLYLTVPLKNKETVMPIESLTVPKEWDNQKDKEIKIENIVEAVQSKNFNPDFESENPFGDVEIVKSDYDGNSYVNTLEKEEDLIVDFKNLDVMEISNEDILCFDILPGDEKEDYITLKNSSDKDVYVYFEILSEEENEFLKNVKLNIGLDDETYYVGTLADNVEKDVICLLKKGEERQLNYEIAFPSEIKNDMQDKEGKFIWVLDSKKVDSPKTADERYIAVLVLILIISGLGIKVFKERRRK